ncbi:hypothetical protein BCR33DRAFT_501512 [Rhizoclosmatium globosum]|uniref:Uncharacterized protein n=1 Tax=Rhizoclosmatium globosum TaxID=329046 RepID=A0A1Y2CVD6_9FUNG|nr:hypothetical protein BCR33DRAFT_501512 [Rhizoclosmatium globosum]|eukprot:ORY51029.1 hypothetical protein BCR33DRAFT_501512 [Rhizoclosmatium globosum]
MKVISTDPTSPEICRQTHLKPLVGSHLPLKFFNLPTVSRATKSPDLVFLFHVDLKSNPHMTPARYIMDATTTAEATTDEVVRNILDLSDLDFSTPQLMVDPQAFVAVAKPLSLAVGVAGGEEGARVGGRVWQTGPGTGTALGHIGRGNTLTHSHSHQIDEAASPNKTMTQQRSPRIHDRPRVDRCGGLQQSAGNVPPSVPRTQAMTSTALPLSLKELLPLQRM